MIKETREILRDRITVSVALLMPLVMLFLFGYAISLDVEEVKLGVLDYDQTEESRALAQRFTASGYFQLSETFANEASLEDALQNGRVKIALVVPPDFQERIRREMPANVQLIVDGTYSATANLAAAYAGNIVAGFHQQGRPAIEIEARVWYNPSLKSVNFVVPGLFGVILMAFPPLLTALGITREKETGSVQQIFASPIRASEFLAGKLIPYAFIAFIQIVMVIVVGFLWFGVPLAGGLGVLLGAGLIYVFCTVGIGLLVSTVTRSQLMAMLLALIVTLMPSFLFSGFLFPIFTMPYALQVYSRLFPAAYFVDLSRSVVLKGSAIVDLWPSVLLLFLYTVAIFVLAAWRFKKKVA